MKRRILILALSVLAVLAVAGCEEKTRYITVADAPATPVGVYSVTGDGYVDVYWQANNDAGNTEGYGVYRYNGTVGGNDQYVLIGEVDASQFYDICHYVDDDVQNGVTYRYAVNAFNGYGESDLSDPDAEDTPRPQGTARAFDFRQNPNSGGFDLSRARIVTADENADVWFEFDPDLNAFFIWAANSGTDIQPWGWADDIRDIGWGDPGEGEGWSDVGWLEIQPNYAYIIWTADNHYGCIWVTSTNTGDYSVNFEWSYQTDEANPQLKRGTKVSPPHAENYGRRSGN